MGRLEGKLIRGFLVLLLGLVNEGIHLVIEEDVLEVIEGPGPELLILDGLLDPLLVGV